MKIPSSQDRQPNDQQNAMTPMIDVVFLLLIFFVCASAGQLREALMPADLAAGSIESLEAVEPEPRPFGEVWLYLRRIDGARTIIQLNQGGESYEDLGVLREQLLALAAATTEIPVILDIEQGIPLGDLIDVYDACLEARFETIHFATSPESLKLKTGGNSL